MELDGSVSVSCGVDDCCAAAVLCFDLRTRLGIDSVRHATAGSTPKRRIEPSSFAENIRPKFFVMC